jgi:hypothetical protein
MGKQISGGQACHVPLALAVSTRARAVVLDRAEGFVAGNAHDPHGFKLETGPGAERIPMHESDVR